MESEKKDKGGAKTRSRMGSTGESCLRVTGSEERIAMRDWLLKRKRESGNKEDSDLETSKEERGKEWVFKKSNKLSRSPIKKDDPRVTDSEGEFMDSWLKKLGTSDWKEIKEIKEEIGRRKSERKERIERDEKDRKEENLRGKGEEEDRGRETHEKKVEKKEVIRALGEIRAEFKREIERIQREMNEREEGVKKEVERIKEELSKKEKEWEEERKLLRSKIEVLEGSWQKVKEIEKSVEEKKEVDGNKKKEMLVVETGVEERVEILERKTERKEREERKKNILVKGLKSKNGEEREGVKKVLEEIGAQVGIEKVKRIGASKGEEECIVVVELGSIDQKREVMEKKKRLKGRTERIMDDLTWKERKMQWRLGEIAREERKLGSRIWIRYGRIQIDGKWWKWDEEKSVLRLEEKQT